MGRLSDDSGSRKTNLTFDDRLEQLLRSYRSYSLDHLTGFSFGSWSLAEDACQLLGMYCRTLLRQTEGALQERGWLDRVSLCNYPIRPRRYGPKILQFYRLPTSFWADVGSVDLVFVDAPSFLYHGREAALYEAFPHMEVGATLFLDDANRVNREREWLMRWEQRYGGNLSVRIMENFQKGFAMVNVLNRNLPLLQFPLQDLLGDAWTVTRFYLLLALGLKKLDQDV